MQTMFLHAQLPQGLSACLWAAALLWRVVCGVRRLSHRLLVCTLATPREAAFCYNEHILSPPFAEACKECNAGIEVELLRGVVRYPEREETASRQDIEGNTEYRSNNRAECSQ